MLCHFKKFKLKVFLYLFAYCIIYSCKNKKEDSKNSILITKERSTGKLHLHPLKIFKKVFHIFHKKPKNKHVNRAVGLDMFKIRFNQYGIDNINYQAHPFARKVQMSANLVKQSVPELDSHPFYTARKAYIYLLQFSRLLKKHNFSPVVLKMLVNKFNTHLITFRDFLRELTTFDKNTEYEGMMNYSYALMHPNYNVHYNTRKNYGLNNDKPYRPLQKNSGATIFNNLRSVLRYSNIGRNFTLNMHGITRQIDQYINELDSQIASTHIKYKDRIRKNNYDRKRYKNDILINDKYGDNSIREDLRFEFRRMLREYEKKIRKLVRDAKTEYRSISISDNIRRNNENYYHRLNNRSLELRKDYNRITNEYLMRIERSFSREENRFFEEEARMKYKNVSHEMKALVHQTITDLKNSSGNFAHFDNNGYHSNIRRIEERVININHEKTRFHNNLNLLGDCSKVNSGHLDPILNQFRDLKRELHEITTQYTNNYEARNSFHREIGNDVNHEIESIMIDLIHLLKKHYMKLFRCYKRNGRMLNSRKIEEISILKNDFIRHYEKIMKNVPSLEMKRNVHSETKHIVRNLNQKFNREIEYLRHSKNFSSLVNNYGRRLKQIGENSLGEPIEHIRYKYGAELNNFNNDLRHHINNLGPHMRDKFNNHPIIKSMRERFESLTKNPRLYTTMGYDNDDILNQYHHHKDYADTFNENQYGQTRYGQNRYGSKYGF